MTGPSPSLFRSRTAVGRAERLALVTARDRVERFNRRLAVIEPGTPQHQRARLRLVEAEAQLRAQEGSK